MKGISINEAIKIAKERNEKVDTIQEYDDAWEFFTDDGIVRYGGGDCSFVVLKENGNVLRFYEYFMDTSRKIKGKGRININEKTNILASEKEKN